MSTETKDAEHAKEQARSQLDSIVAMVRRCEHAAECFGNDEDCDASHEQIYEGLNLYWQDGDTADEAEREEYHDEERARLAIEEDALSVEVRGDWHTPGDEGGGQPSEYRVCLCTGGPAVQITGDYNQGPETACLEYQDWFTPWVEYTDVSSEEQKAMLFYVGCFLFDY